jgi:pimeloyl-ACP methyl ester carboxylesterase
MPIFRKHIKNRWFYKSIMPSTLGLGLIFQNLPGKFPGIFSLWFLSLGGGRGGLYISLKPGWKLIVLNILLFVAYAEARAQGSSFTFYNSENHDSVEIATISEWEQYRWKLLRNMEAIMGPLPDRFSLPDFDIQIKDTLKEKTYMRLTLDFQAVADERVPAYLYIPYRKSITGKLPAILALHPTGMAGKKIVDGEGHVNRAYAKELAERGYIVIAPDYPSFGELANYDFSADRYESGTMAAIFYHIRCVDLLTAREDVDPDRIGVIGHSLGGHNAMFVGAFDERLKVIVSSCGWTQLEYYDIGLAANERYGGRLGPFAQDRYMPLFRDKYNLNGDKIPFNFHEIIALFAPRAFFSNSPLNDSNFDVKGVIKGIEIAKGAYRFLHAEDKLQVRYPEAEHDFPSEIRMEAYRFIDQILEHVPTNHYISTEIK